MTIEERFERIEHVTAGLAEERRKDREEFRSLWRDTQRQLNDLTVKLADLGDRVTQIAEESRAADRRLEQRMEDADQRLAERIAETDRSLGERIAAMVSAIGEFIAASKPSTPPA